MYSSFSSAALAVSIVFPLLALCAVAARVCARKVKEKKLGADDWVIVVDLIIVLGLGAMTAWASVAGGIGDSLQAMNADLRTKFLKQLWVNELLAIVAIGLVKISVLLFYKRIFSTRGFRLVANAMIAVVICWTVGIFLALTFSIIPVSNQWDPFSTRTHGLNFPALLIAMGSTDIALDVTILCLPLPMIKKLNLSTRRKIMLCGVFWLGAFCVVASIARLVYIVKFLRVYGPNDAFSGITSNIIIWSEIEPCASIVAACLPTIMPLFKGGRSPASLIASVRSYVSLVITEKRKDSQDSRTSGSDHSTGRENREWQKLDGHAFTATAVGVESGYMEEQSGIKVDKSFGSEVGRV